MKRCTKGGERAILVHIYFSTDAIQQAIQEDLTEFKQLVSSAGALSLAVVTGSRQTPESKYFVGTGKAQEIRSLVLSHAAELVIFNHALSPAQERNLEKLFQCRVIGRTGLILDIFAQRARSFEGKLQVELALLKHISTRLVRGWTHLERQRGGIGLRGPGETQLETDRRLIRNRIQFILKRLNRVKKQREQNRRARQKAMYPTIALVGYTNAGKSTLFNQLTGAEVYVADRLFATLDPTLRRMTLPEIGTVILADTVGFIRHLPHDLVEAFQATLEEVRLADLLLHVVDASDAHQQANIAAVNAVLASIDAQTVPQLLVYNKMDLCRDKITSLDHVPGDTTKKVWISAAQGMGMELLQQAIVMQLGKKIIQQLVVLTPAESRLRATLYRLQAVLSETVQEDGSFQLLVRLPQVEWDKLFGLKARRD